MASKYEQAENDFMLEFIQKYKEFECLWKTTDLNYTNKYVRLQCLKELLKIMKKRDPDADIGRVKRKINSIRCNFNKQHKKVMQSRAFTDDDGDDTESNVHKMRNYELLLFLVNRNPKIEDTNETNMTYQSSAYSEDENDKIIYFEGDISNEETDCLKEFKKEEPCSGTSTPRDFITVSTDIKKRRLTNLTDNITQGGASSHQTLYLTDEADESTSSKNPQYNSFGEHVAESLRCMSKEMAIYCQKIISDAIFHAGIGDLNNTSRIVTDHY